MLQNKKGLTLTAATLAAALFITFAVGGMVTLGAEDNVTDAPTVPTPAAALTRPAPADPLPALEAPAIADQLSTAFENVAERVRPSVVSVRSLRKVSRA